MRYAVSIVTPTPAIAPASAAALPAQGGRTYFPELDGVRAIAIAMVMAFHLAQPAPGLLIAGQSGVDIFFVLSGFLITGILLKAPPRDWREVRTFYIRRALRVFPLYYLFLLATVLAGYHPCALAWIYLQNLRFSVGLLDTGLNHLWSLAVEEQFYLVWPFVVLFLPRRRLQPVLLAIAAAAFLVRFPLIAWKIVPFYFTLSRADALAAGALLALQMSAGRLHAMRPAMLLTLALSAALLAAQAAATLHHPNLLWVQTTKFSLFAAFYASGIGLLLTGAPAPLRRLLTSQPLRFTGRISYGLYLVHPVIFAWVFTHLRAQPPLLRVALALLAAYACATLSWYGIERRFLRLKDKLAPERTRFPVSTLAETAKPCIVVP